MGENTIKKKFAISTTNNNNENIHGDCDFKVTSYKEKKMLVNGVQLLALVAHAAYCYAAKGTRTS